MTRSADVSLRVAGTPAPMSNTQGFRRIRIALLLAVVGTLVPLVCLAIPMYVIHPFRPQDQSQLAPALWIRGVSPRISAVCALVVVLAALLIWKRTNRRWLRIAFATLSVIAVFAACLTNINIFEIMFHPYSSPVFEGSATVQVDSDDKVLTVKIGTVSHAYPIRTMGYHHIVNDTVGGIPIAVTYCTLCHTGLVWSRVLNDRTLYFRLAASTMEMP